MRILAALLAIAVCISAIVLADAPAARYGSASNAQDCLAYQMAALPSETKTLLVGSSRIRRGVSPEQVAEAFDHEGLVYNLGRPGFSTARTYVQLRDLYAAGYTPEIVVIEAELDVLRGAYDVSRLGKHWAWEVDTAPFMTYGDIFTLPTTASGAGSIGYLGLIADAVMDKVSHATARYLSNQVKPLNRVGTGLPLSVCMLPQFDAPDEGRRARAKAQKQEQQLRFQDEFGDLETSLDGRFTTDHGGTYRAELYYLQKIRELTQSHGSAFFVVRLHMYALPPYTPDVTHQLQALVPEVLIPPADVIRDTQDGFMDTTHLGPEARAIYTRWLTTTIQERLDAM